MRPIQFLLILIFAVYMNSCTTSKVMSDNQKSSGHFRLYTYPEKLAEKTIDTNRFKKLVFVSSNDFAGHIKSQSFPIKNRMQEKKVLKVGGLAAMRAYYDIFKKAYTDHVAFVDAGSFMAKEQNHSYTIFLYNYLAPDAVGLGDQEFNLNSNRKNYFNYLESLTSKSRFPLLNANLFDLTQAKELRLNGVRENTMKTMNGIKVGFVSILDQKMSESIPKSKLNGVYIQNTSKNIITKSARLRRLGAKVIVLLTNSSIDCHSQIAQEESLPMQKVNFEPRKSNHCMTYNNSLFKILNQIPPKTVDLIITSGENAKVANFIQGYPVMQNEGKGEYLSWSELYFDTKHEVIDQKKTIIHQPVQLCHNFLKKHQDCYYLENLDEKELIPASFLGQKIQIKDIPKL